MDFTNWKDLNKKKMFLWQITYQVVAQAFQTFELSKFATMCHVHVYGGCMTRRKPNRKFQNLATHG
jgi:hypothetical protein